MPENEKIVVREQLSLFQPAKKTIDARPVLEKLIDLLKGDLNFHNQVSEHFAHNVHSFPAKFPPQLPKVFIEALTAPLDVVLDPMVGSGTSVIESYYANRKGIGFDIDPLAIRIARAKVTPLNRRKFMKYGLEICRQAKIDFLEEQPKLQAKLTAQFDPKTKVFLDYWFLPETQLELVALWNRIQNVSEEKYRNFFEVLFSSLIVTKSGGVSLALDLGHTRPHKIKALLDSSGQVIWGDVHFNKRKKNFVTKYYRSAFEEFRKRLEQNVAHVPEFPVGPEPQIDFCDSQNLCLDNETIDLIITSPPYASNAIDYMRAHKFSLVWFGHRIEELTKKRNEYIGSESTQNYFFEELPPFTAKKIEEVSARDTKRGKVLRRYFSEMKRSLGEMFRVLKHGKAAIVVVGNSVMKGVDTETPLCLSEIGRSIGFLVPHIGVRQLDRNKRMLPTSKEKNLNSQIQKRMHEEFVIGFYKP